MWPSNLASECRIVMTRQIRCLPDNSSNCAITVRQKGGNRFDVFEPDLNEITPNTDSVGPRGRTTARPTLCELGSAVLPATNGARGHAGKRQRATHEQRPTEIGT